MKPNLAPAAAIRDRPLRPRPGFLRRALAAAVLLAAAGCVTTVPYLDPAGPRHAGVAEAPSPAGPAAPWGGGDGRVAGDPEAPLRIGSFNIEDGRDVDAALAVIVGDSTLAAADFLLLQEVDAAGTARIAGALGMSWVYYPAGVRNGRGWGNAVLSRWPVEADEKIVLPHRAWVGGTRRIATAVTARVGDVPVRVYSVHLATPLNQSRGQREDQLRAVLDDASAHPLVIIGGDFNSDSLAELAVEEGYAWPTRDGPRTVWFARVDHVVFRGLDPTPADAAGTVGENRGASDHLPVWARGRIR